MVDNTMLLIAMGGGGLMFLALLFYGMGGDQQMAKRLQRVGSGEAPKAKAAKNATAPVTAIRHIKKKSFLDGLAENLPNIEKLRGKIARTGQNISIQKYCIWMILSAIAGFLLFRVVFGAGTVVTAAGTIIFGIGLPYKIIMRMGDKRNTAFIANFPEAIDTMCRGLRSGLPVSESINAVAREMPDPVGEEFRRMADGIRLGQSIDDTMWEVARRINTPEFRFLIISMAIQRETGGNLAETLGGLADLLRRRRQLKLKIRAMSSEARASAMIIGSLPFVMFTLLLVVSKQYALTLVNTPQGHTLLMIGGSWMSVGIYVMKQMVDFEI